MITARTALSGALLAILLAGCASTPPPDGLRSTAEGALASAEAADAEEHAPIELRFAREKLAGARLAVEERDYARAARLLEQSLVNSELAMAKTAAAKAREAVRRQDAANAELRSDLTSGEEL
ncbi:MAG: DUF4398 domain-containing protein [Pseudomonadota bacterium]